VTYLDVAAFRRHLRRGDKGQRVQDDEDLQAGREYAAGTRRVLRSVALYRPAVPRGTSALRAAVPAQTWRRMSRSPGADVAANNRRASVERKKIGWVTILLIAGTPYQLKLQQGRPGRAR
jgi:hypothetical protein